METKTLIFLLALVVVLTRVGGGEGKEHVVGGTRSNGWGPNVNYSLWASHETFYVGDWLTFFYQKGYYDVVQVDETDYERCSPDHPIQNDSMGSSYAFQLDDVGPYFFICSHGQCWGGMKLAIVVEPHPHPPPPAPSSSNASTTASAVASWVRASLSAVCSIGMYLY